MNQTKYAITVQNMDSDISQYPYVIIRLADGGLWFYGADNNYERSCEIAKNLGNAMVIENNPIE